ncbi:unnamed protein product [Dracunculus medinensis]|uniref:BRCA2 and CDKN1A-interacting protein n=1 Tax=Dracunculus medinensis TaxID=318479 RepID=A0A0N4UES3_DRAME|nr:unnamed protein product [Dracunculus medinensis]
MATNIETNMHTKNYNNLIIALIVIEAPSAPALPYDEVEREREQQEAFGKEVLKQIQAFGESANDEFDVQWAHDKLNTSPLDKKIFILDESTAPQAKQDSTPIFIEDMSTQRENEPLDVKTSSGERKNPFLDDDDDDAIKIVEENDVDMCDLDYTIAAKYYNNQYSSRRPGPVYTIPEDEEQNDGQIGTDSKYYAKEIVRRVSSPKITTVPITPTISVKISKVEKPPKTVSHATKTVSSDDYYDQMQKGQAGQTRFIASSKSVTTAATSSFTTPMQNVESITIVPAELETQENALTPVRNAPPPPSETICNGFSDDVNLFETSAFKAEDGGAAWTTDNPKPLQQLDAEDYLFPKCDESNAKIQSSDITTASASFTLPSCIISSFSQPIVTTTSVISRTLGSTLESAVHGVPSQKENISAIPKLKRSPAMLLANGQSKISSTSDQTSIYRCFLQHQSAASVAVQPRLKEAYIGAQMQGQQPIEPYYLLSAVLE